MMDAAARVRNFYEDVGPRPDAINMDWSDTMRKEDINQFLSHLKRHQFPGNITTNLATLEILTSLKDTKVEDIFTFSNSNQVALTISFVF
jgi:hypothetical protein